MASSEILFCSLVAQGQLIFWNLAAMVFTTAFYGICKSLFNCYKKNFNPPSKACLKAFQEKLNTGSLTVYDPANMFSCAIAATENTAY